MSGSEEKGFTLVEMLVVTILGALMILATHQILQVTQRSFTVVQAQVQGQQSLRGAMDVLFGELREISAAGGDLMAMGPDTLSIRTMRRAGFVCAIDYAPNPPRLTVVRLGQWFEEGDSVFVFADNNPTLYDDDVWLSGRIAGTVDTIAICPSGDAAQVLGVQGLGTTDSVRVGATIRSFRRLTYGIREVNGQSYLTQAVSGSAPEPVVGPLRPSSQGGLEFAYLDANGVATMVPAEVAQIQVTLRTSSLARTPAGDVISDSVRTRIKLRN